MLKVAHHSNDIAHSPKLNKPSITNPGRPLTPLRKRRGGPESCKFHYPHRAARQKAARKASQSVTGRKRLTQTKARRKARIPSYGSRSGTGQRISKIQVQIRRCQRCCGRSSRQQRRRASRRRATCSLTSAPGTVSSACRHSMQAAMQLERRPRAGHRVGARAAHTCQRAPCRARDPSRHGRHGDHFEGCRRCLEG